MFIYSLYLITSIILIPIFQIYFRREYSIKLKQLNIAKLMGRDRAMNEIGIAARAATRRSTSLHLPPRKSRTAPLYAALTWLIYDKMPIIISKRVTRRGNDHDNWSLASPVELATSKSNDVMRVGRRQPTLILLNMEKILNVHL